MRRPSRAFFGLGCCSPPAPLLPSPAAGIMLVVLAIARFSFFAWISASIFARLKYSSYSCGERRSRCSAARRGSRPGGWPGRCRGSRTA